MVSRFHRLLKRLDSIDDECLPGKDPNIDHRGYIVQVMKDDKGVPTGVYLVSLSDMKRSLIVCQSLNLL